jgi:hypothetical protein
MIERITENEEKLDSILLSIKNLENALKDFKANKKNLHDLNKYYGSKTWFKDKEKYENNEIPSIKAGILSEDAAWNMFEDIEDLLNEMQDIINNFQKKEK